MVLRAYSWFTFRDHFLWGLGPYVVLRIKPGLATVLLLLAPDIIITIIIIITSVTGVI